MRWLWKWIKRALMAGVLLTLLLLAPVGYVEFVCRGDGTPAPYEALLPPEDHRPEARTLLTYPEWHIVHTYDDYAEVIRTGDPHDFGYLRSIAGFWRSLCALSEEAWRIGPVDGGTKQMVYVIGVSFTAELLAKAAYEETVGRVVTWLRGDARAPLDELSAEQAAAYAEFLQQVPWYKWDFRRDAEALEAAATDALRDRERALALGLEYRAKAAYAGVIADAVATVGPDALTLRMVVTGSDMPEGVTVIAEIEAGTVIETPRYRALTGLLAEMAVDGMEFVEIAGNDDILLTVTSEAATAEGALFSFPRQGYGDFRHLLVVKVADLAETLRGLGAAGLRLEHIHDY